MDFFQVSGFVSLVINGGLAFFVYKKNPTRKLNVSFAAFSLSIAFWSVGSSYVNLFSNYKIALWTLRQSYLFGVFLPPLFLYFITTFIGWEKAAKPFLVFCTAIAVLLAFIVPTPLLISSFQDLAGHGYRIDMPGPAYIFFAIYFTISVFSTLVLVVIYFFKNASTQKKRQLIFIFVAYFFASIAGLEYFSSVYGVLNRPPFDDYALILTCAIMAYAIIAHQLMEIEVIIKKTLVFAGLFAMVMAIVTGVTTLTQDVLGEYFSISPTVGTLISVVIAVFLYEPAKNFLIHATDKYLFQKKLDFKLVLNRLSNDIITILDIEKAGSTILSTLKTTLRLESGVIFIKDENENDYRTLESFGVEKSPRRLMKDNLLLQYLFETKNMVNLEDLEQRKNLPVEVLKILDACKAAITIPLFVGSDLIGVLMLGKKQSDQEFSQDEIGYFPTIAGQVAIALSNARLYDLLKKSQIDFAQQAKMAAIGTLSAGISHEIKNPLNHIKVGISMLRMNKKHGVLDQMERYKMEEEVFRTLEILDENVTRANEVIERLSSFAKKPKELKIEPVDLTAAVGQALSFVEKEYEHHQIEIEKNFPEHIPLVNADLHTLEDVFLNLLVNARHAILDHGKVTISASTTDGVLDLTIKDTGKGISKENLAKIWDPFFTTKDVSRNPDKSAVKGSGLGLFIVREFIQRFGGNITVESTLGRGTTFHVVFPEAVWAK